MCSSLTAELDRFVRESFSHFHGSIWRVGMGHANDSRSYKCGHSYRCQRVPKASSVGANIGICKGDQFVPRKVYVSKSRDKPAIMSAYPTHLLGGIAMLDLDSTLDGHVPKTFGQEYESDRRNGMRIRRGRGIGREQNAGFEIEH